MSDHIETLKSFPKRVGVVMTKDDAEAVGLALRDIHHFRDALHDLEHLKKDVEHHKQEVAILMLRNSALQDVIVRQEKEGS